MSALRPERTGMSKKGFLANILFGKLGFLTLPISGLRRAKGKILPVLAYHRVNLLPGADYPFSGGTISAGPDEFDRQMAFVSRRFDVINFGILSELLSSGAALPANPLIITFDDGYADNYDVAFKILLKYKLTATIFVSTSFIDSGEPFWHDKLHYILRSTLRKIVTFDSGRYKVTINHAKRHEAIESISHIFGSVPDKDRVRFFQELEEQSKVDMPPDLLKLVAPLNWGRIREMSACGIEFGSHTVSHPHLSRMTEDEIMSELVTSKAVIREKAGVEVISVAYPFGSYNETVMKCAKRSGHRFGIAYEHDVWRLDKTDVFAIPRIHVERDVASSLFQANLLLPWIFVKHGR
jgi:peptidoglycan/xylan/chitin deacetylase (PgdA/CDA1 family)